MNLVDNRKDPMTSGMDFESGRLRFHPQAFDYFYAHRSWRPRFYVGKSTQHLYNHKRYEPAER